ncbi:MAG TPA: hypothetical protein DCM40_02370 [Maribacter sp.]|nr:hypothetical protein [Maribacter sp.]
MAKNLPDEIDLVVYAEEKIPACAYERIKWIDLNNAEPELFKFKTRHKNDPVANGKLGNVEGGVRRLPELQKLGGLDKNKESFLWDAVRFANKVFCVINAVRNSLDYNYVVWLDADTNIFRPMPFEFITKLLPQDTMVTYLGRENPTLNDGGKYPECGFVGYNLQHPETQNFINEWERLYKEDSVFKILEWHDSYVFWHLTKKFRQEKLIEVNDIGKWVGVKGHHVFVNSVLGQYIDHMKGDRKIKGSSSKKDLKTTIDNVEYWKNVPPA